MHPGLVWGRPGGALLLLSLLLTPSYQLPPTLYLLSPPFSLPPTLYPLLSLSTPYSLPPTLYPLLSTNGSWRR